MIDRPSPTVWRDRRKASGLSIRQLERLSGINRGRLSVIERGVPPEPQERDAILRALEMPEIRA